MNEQKQTKSDPAVYDTKVIDLHAERMKMAEKDGLTVADLDVQVNMKRGEYYEASIRAFHQGRDAGYNEGLVRGIRVRWPWFVWLGAGVLAAPLSDKLWRLVVMVYNF